MKYYKLTKAIPGTNFSYGLKGKIFGVEDNKVFIDDNMEAFYLSPAIIEFCTQIDCKFKVGDKVMYLGKCYEVSYINMFGDSLKIVSPDKSTEILSVTTRALKKAKEYWFINSEGTCCKILEEKTNSDVLRYRKSIGNYFTSKEECKKYTLCVKLKKDER